MKFPRIFDVTKKNYGVKFMQLSNHILTLKNFPKILGTEKKRLIPLS